jgi:hypothetical protein
MRVTVYPLTSLLLVLLPAALPADEAGVPRFTLHTADGVAGSGPVEELREDWSVVLGGETALRARGGDVVALRRVAAALPAFPRHDQQQVLFTNGDRVPGKVLGLRDEQLRFQADIGAGRELTVPLSAVSVLWFAAPGQTDDVEALQRRLATEKRTQDSVLLRNGDVVEGTLVSLNEGAVQVEADGKQVDLDRTKVAVIACNTELSRTPRPRGAYARAVLANGGRLSLASAQADGRTLTGTTLQGVTVRLPLQELLALDVRQGRAVYLSDLKPRRYEHVPYLGTAWPWVADASVTGRDLRLGGSVYDKGLGVHSESRLTYDLAGGYRWFEAVVGLDEKTGRDGSVRIRVLVDGKPQDVGGDRELTGQDAPRVLRVRTDGAKELTLVVEFGRGGDVADHVNWADARLINGHAPTGQ